MAVFIKLNLQEVCLRLRGEKWLRARFWQIGVSRCSKDRPEKHPYQLAFGLGHGRHHLLRSKPKTRPDQQVHFPFKLEQGNNFQFLWYAAPSCGGHLNWHQDKEDSDVTFIRLTFLTQFNSSKHKIRHTWVKMITSMTQICYPRQTWEFCKLVEICQHVNIQEKIPSLNRMAQRMYVYRHVTWHEVLVVK